VQRYQGQGVTANFEVWRFDRRRRTVAGENLRIAVLEPARIHWSSDGWHTTHDDLTQDTGLGAHFFDLPAATLAAGTIIVFTLFWPQHQRWEGSNFSVEVVGCK
jgi:glucoamylase